MSTKGSTQPNEGMPVADKMRQMQNKENVKGLRSSGGSTFINYDFRIINREGITFV